MKYLAKHDIVGKNSFFLRPFEKKYRKVYFLSRLPSYACNISDSL